SRVAVRNAARQRSVDLGADVLTNDAMTVVEDPSVDVVVELIGGIEPARELILTALQNGKAVVTGNKELLANVGAELFEAAEKAGVDLLFEAAVAGGIPLIRPLRESLAGDRVQRILGIVNGTTNFILTRMTEEGSTFHEALGDLMLYGRGAGGRPTASAVLGDVIDAAANRRRGTHAPLGALSKARIRPIDELSSEYYVALEVVDRPGVLAEVAGVFGKHLV